ncbi:MAG TPA: hypothetical protein VFF13_00600 [archaeon]|nr:hypothetical protein [archaeon]
MLLSLEEVFEEETILKKAIKKDCLLCMGRSRLLTNKNAPEKAQVQASLNNLRNVYGEKYNLLRKANASGDEIQLANNNRRHMLDIINTCTNCDREVDRANREVSQMK